MSALCLLAFAALSGLSLACGLQMMTLFADARATDDAATRAEAVHAGSLAFVTAFAAAAFLVGALA